MKPVAFDYRRPTTVGEAAAALRDSDGAARIVAGGQSIGPMLNLRLVQPRLLVDIGSVAELHEVVESKTALVLGACVTAADIEDGRATASGLTMLRAVAGGIAYRAVRNRGTIGGSLCHADPAADWVNVLPALGAQCTIKGPTGSRVVPVAGFMTAAFENALEEGEVLTAVTIPKPSAGARWGFHKIARKTGKFAMALGAVLHDPACGVFRAVIGATQGRPIVVEDARELFSNKPVLIEDALNDAMLSHLFDSHGITSASEQQLHRVALVRAAEDAFAS
jgi:aerobic carbon-monoxide dehydrogenase medium subunit